MNNQIFITAAIVTIIALVILLLLQIFLKFNWKFVWIPFIIMLPGSFLINYAVKDWLLGALSLWSPQNIYVLFLVYYVLWVLIVGITEELIKISPVAIPQFRNYMKETEVGKFSISWSLGTGFGIGEVWYLAYILSIGTSIEGYLWYQLTGFIFERFVVIFLHGAFTVLALYGYKRRKLWLTIILAIIAHGVIDYLAIASYLAPFIYAVFVILAIIGISLALLAYLDAKGKDKKKEWQNTLVVEEEIAKEQEHVNNSEIKSLFPSTDENK